MNEQVVYKSIEFAIFALYMIFIFLAVQIWFLWKDIDKNQVKVNIFVNESFFKKNCIYVFSFSIFFIVHEIFENISLPNAIIYFEFFEMLGFISIVLFAHYWYAVLKTAAHKKSLPREFTDFTRQ